MISNLSVSGFKGVPYLETSSLMTLHANKLRFSKTKPNVLVGPNGSGKSALLQTLAIRFLAYFTGQSFLDDKFVLDGDAKAWWTREREWGNDYEWLKGLTCKTDNAPALYYRPGHIPGNETSITHAMMCGYFEEARAYGKLVDEKSSGQQSQAVMQPLLAALAGEGLPCAYGHKNWRFGDEPRTFDYPRHGASYDHQAEVLKALYRPEPSAIPLILLDEPEQSLDARAEARLWQAISQADGAKVQVIVATHSLYPLTHPKKFNIIETEAGFVNDVLALLK